MRGRLIRTWCLIAGSVLTAKEGSATPDYASQLPCVFPEEALLANKVDETREDRSGSKRRVSDARQVIVVFACVFPQTAQSYWQIFILWEAETACERGPATAQPGRTSNQEMNHTTYGRNRWVGLINHSISHVHSEHAAMATNF